jgi:hypothetical protein
VDLRTFARAVFVTLTRVRTGDQPIENATIVAEEMLGWFQSIEGFRGFLMLSREGTTIGLSFWENEDAAMQNRMPRTQFIERISAVVDVEIEERAEYEVTFADLGGLRVDGSM